jgi:hypothetical protein
VSEIAIDADTSNVIPLRPVSREDAATAWFRERVTRPFDPAVVFDSATIARAAEWAAASPTSVAIREIVRASKAPLRQWDSAVTEARNALAKDRAERDRGFSTGEEWRGELLTDKDGCPRPSLGNACAFLEHTHAHRLTFDEMAVAPMIDGRPLEDADVSRIRIDVEKTEGIEIGKETASDAILHVARARSSHPVKTYLRSLVHDGEKRIGKLAADYLGAPDPLSKVLVVRTLIAAVARALNPGCQVDTVLVLVGSEGFKKSTFFRTLAGMWFGDSTADISDRKGIMTMKAAWLYEWPEVERMMLKKAESEIKAFVTQRDDMFVPMYGRGVERKLRSNIVVASTNEDRFLTSSTGSRRWWVVTVTKRIDAVDLAANRDQIWAEAVALYDMFVKTKAIGVPDDENPYRWWLNEEEESARKVRNEDYASVSADEQTVGAWLAGEPVQCAACKGTGEGFGRDAGGNAHACPTCQGKKKIEREPFAKDSHGATYITIVDVLSGPMGIPAKEQTPAATQRAAFTIRRLGWTSGKRFRVGDRTSNKVTPYYPPASDPADVPPPAPVEPAATSPRAPDGHCEACVKPRGRGAGKCQSCGVCSGCLDVPAGVHGACHCEAG